MQARGWKGGTGAGGGEGRAPSVGGRGAGAGLEGGGAGAGGGGAGAFDRKALCGRKDRKIEQAQGRKKQAPSIKKHETSAKIGTSISMAQVLRRKELTPSRS